MLYNYENLLLLKIAIIHQRLLSPKIKQLQVSISKRKWLISTYGDWQSELSTKPFQKLPLGKQIRKQMDFGNDTGNCNNNIWDIAK